MSIYIILTEIHIKSKEVMGCYWGTILSTRLLIPEVDVKGRLIHVPRATTVLLLWNNASELYTMWIYFNSICYMHIYFMHAVNHL